MKTIDLTISDVPEVDSVIAEIKNNAAATIHNYWDTQIRVVPEEKEVEFKEKIDSFRLVNDMVATPIAEEVVEEVIVEKPIIKEEINML